MEVDWSGPTMNYVDGLNVHAVVFDELHAQPNRQLYDVMTHGSGDARKQPLYFLITTAGNDTNSICYEVHQKARDILDGRKLDSAFYPVIYGADEGEDWTSPAVWKKANPSLGITVEMEKLVAACDSARQNPAEGNVVHYGFIEAFIEKLGMAYHILEIAFDRWGATQMVQNLEGRLAHGGNPVLRWMMDNIHVPTDPAGNVKPDKEKSTEKIDGAMAAIMALDRAVRCGGDTGVSVYDERGLLLL